MNLFFRLAWRNVWRHRRRTLIVVLAIGMSIALMMLYDGMMDGFTQAIYANAVKVLGGNIQVHAEGYRAKADDDPLLPLADSAAVVQAAQAQPQVMVAAPRIQTTGMVTNREGAFAVNIAGIQPEIEQPANLVLQKVTEGRSLTAADQDSVLIGKGLAIAMNVALGDRITLIGRSNHGQMRQRTMTITGIYDVGMTEIEKRTLYVSLTEAQDLYNLTGQSTEVVIFLNQLGEEQPVITAMRAAIPSGYEIESWETNFPELTQAINSKSGVMNVFGVIIILIAGIGILNMLLMAVFERTREIGLMGAMGLKPRQITWLFLLEGALMGLVGVVFGVALGMFTNFLLGQVGIDYSKMAGVAEYTALINGRIYPSLGAGKLPLRVITVLIISLLASYYPAREAALSEPAEALHYV